MTKHARIPTLVAVLAAVAVVAASTAAPQSARAAGRSVQVLTVVNSAGVPGGRLRRIERALVSQVDTARRWWKQMPAITFGSGGWPIYIIRSGRRVTAMCRAEDAGCHGPALTGVATVDEPATPWAVVDAGHYLPALEATFSHELLEMLADPTTTATAEICDPADEWLYSRGGVMLNDFVLPRYFSREGRGRLDYLGKLHEEPAPPHGGLRPT